MTEFSFTNKLPKNTKWILEFTQGIHSAHLFEVKKEIAHKKTSFQAADIVDLFHYGKTLFLDERLQVSEKDEFLYHEPIVHPALMTHPNPKSVLVIGGADGGTIFQVLKYKSVKRVVLAELDKELIELTKKHLSCINRNAFNDKRLEIITGDGRKFLAETKEKFDIIISDLTAPLINPPSYLLFTEEFYKIVFEKLNKDGIFSLQADSANHLNGGNFTAIFNTVKKVFPITKGLQAFIPSYDDSWGFVIASKKYDPTKIKPVEIKKRIKQRNIKDLQFYNENIHFSLFALPKALEDSIKKEKKIIRDNNPMISEE
jgi:spermidine synthase